MADINQGAREYALCPGFNFLFLCVCFLCVMPCYGLGISEKQNSAQIADELIFTGVSPKLFNRDEAIQTAVRDAAKKLSLYYSAGGNSVKSEYIGSGIFNYRVSSDYRLQYDNDLEKYIDLLEYDPVSDVYERYNAIFVITRTRSSISMPLFRDDSISKSQPYWIETPPNEINGFTTGVGFSARFYSHHNTVVKSYESAVMAIIEKTGTIEVMGRLQNNQNSYDMFGFETTGLNETRVFGELKHFYIIETWTNPADLSVWTLAVANKG